MNIKQFKGRDTFSYLYKFEEKSKSYVETKYADESKERREEILENFRRGIFSSHMDSTAMIRNFNKNCIGKDKDWKTIKKYLIENYPCDSDTQRKLKKIVKREFKDMRVYTREFSDLVDLAAEEGNSSVMR